jgi:outer membrane protein assembly factor BamA
VGHILWFNRNEKIVPSDRHYFAGGAASIRSFASRNLGDATSNDPNLPSNVGDLANYVGWATIVELSAELRYTFPYYADLGEFLADKISRLGLTFFLDAGNAFNRFTPAAYGKASVSHVLDPRNWALAAGTGIRFATPVGPARLDLGINVYDPTMLDRKYAWITSRNIIESITAQIGLGHAF